MDALDYFVIYVVPQLHLGIVWVLGIVLAFVYRRSHPRRALTAGIAFALLLLIAAIETTFTILLAPQGPGLPADLETAYHVANHLLVRVVSVIAWLLLMQAVYGWRTPAEALEPAPRVRWVVVGTVTEALLFAVLSAAAPYFRDLQARGIVLMTAFGGVWGAVTAAALLLTSGALRGVVAGVTAAGGLVLIWASGQDAPSARAILVLAPFPALCLGALVGLGLTWGLRRRSPRGNPR